MNNIYLSVIIPAYNESRRIGGTLQSVQNYLKIQNYSYEIIVVNDGSTDDTGLILKKIAEEIPQLKIIDNHKNEGKGYAVKCGMAEAKGDLQLFMDADNSVKINEIKNFILKITEGYDVVIGSIGIGKLIVGERNGFYRRPLGVFSKFLIRMLVTPGIYDTQRGFKLFTKKAALEIFPQLTIKRFGFDIEVLVIAQKNNLKIKELPVQFDNPKGSKVSLFSYVETFFELLKIIVKLKI
jgi:dolichyl-phosphate beta-glucosyltransferase